MGLKHLASGTGARRVVVLAYRLHECLTGLHTGFISDKAYKIVQAQPTGHRKTISTTKGFRKLEPSPNRSRAFRAAQLGSLRLEFKNQRLPIIIYAY